MYTSNRHISTVQTENEGKVSRGGQLWRAITQAVYVRFEKFKNWLKGNVKHYLLATGKFATVAEISYMRYFPVLQ